MPVAASHHTTAASATDASSYLTAEISSPAANGLLLITVVSTKATTPEIPTVTGLGVTWVRVNGVEYSAGTQRIDVFRAMGNPVNGRITISYATVHTGCLWSVVQFTGVDTGGTNGSAAVVQSNVGTTTAAALTVNLNPFGNPNNVTFGGFGRANNTAPVEGAGYTKFFDANINAPAAGIMTQRLLAPDPTVEATQSGGSNIGFGGVALEIKGTEPRSSFTKQFRTTDISADVDTIDTGTEASNSATIARFAAGGAVSSRRFDPGTATGPSAAVPAAPSTAAGMGWRENPAIQPSEAITIQAQTITVTLRVRRSGQSLEQDQNSDVTVILYRVDSVGAHIAEMGRATVRFTWTTAAVDRAFAIAVAATQFAAGDRIQAEVYVVTLNALNNPTAPAVATDLIIQVGAVTDSRMSPITYFMRYVNSQSVSGVGTVATARRIIASRLFSVSGLSTVAFSRRIVANRLFSVSGVSTVAFIRRIGYLRASSVSGAGVANFVRRLILGRSASVSGVGTVTTTRRIVASKLFSVVGTGSAIFSRRIQAIRVFSVSGVATVVFNRLVRSGRNFVVTGVATVSSNRLVAYFRTHSVTGVGVAVFSRTIQAFRNFSVVGIGAAITGKAMNFARSFVVSGTSQIRMRIEMAQAVLNRMEAGGTTVIRVVKKFFTIGDD